jgi:hypothetical protein
MTRTNQGKLRRTVKRLAIVGCLVFLVGCGATKPRTVQVLVEPLAKIPELGSPPQQAQVDGARALPSGSIVTFPKNKGWFSVKPPGGVYYPKKAVVDTTNELMDLRYYASGLREQINLKNKEIEKHNKKILPPPPPKPWWKVF